MKKNLVFPTIVTASLLALSSCDKSGTDVSILAETKEFQQAATFVPRKLDVLFVVDNSGSMSSSQNSLAANFPSFINYFKSKGYDFRIAVTTSDTWYADAQYRSTNCSLCNDEQARFRSGTTPKIYVVDNNTQDLENVFSANVKVGINGSGDERVFSSFKTTLSSPLNNDFHRADAYLAVILVSDEEDFSYDGFNMNESYSNPALHSVASYKSFLESYTNGQASKDFAVSTISILDETCRSSLGSGRKIGTRYMQLADMTGGTKNSLCSSFATVLDNISTSIATSTQAVFQLNKKPVVSSIRVIINGIVVPQSSTNGWEYDATSNSISIKGSTYQPEAGASVSINFDPESLG